MNPVKVQHVQLGNLNTAAMLFESQLHEHEVRSTANGLRDALHAVIANPHLGFILLATCNEDPIGVAYVAALLSLEHEGIIGWLEELYVLPENRNAGVGSHLLREAIDCARELGWKGVELEIMAGHERVASIYVRHGFQPVSRSRFCQLFYGEQKNSVAVNQN